MMDGEGDEGKAKWMGRVRWRQGKMELEGG